MINEINLQIQTKLHPGFPTLQHGNRGKILLLASQCRTGHGASSLRGDYLFEQPRKRLPM